MNFFLGLLLTILIFMSKHFCFHIMTTLLLVLEGFMIENEPISKISF